MFLWHFFPWYIGSRGKNNFSWSEAQILRKIPDFPVFFDDPKGRTKMDNVIFYDNDAIFPQPVQRYETHIELIESDTFSAAEKYKKPCCLSFASHINPGGGYKHRPYPQEENLFCRSNLPELLDNEEVKKYYPLMGTKALFCPSVIVKLDKDLKPLDKEFEVSVITLPAIANPSFPDDIVLFNDKIERIFQIAAKNKVKTLILGSYGNGCFKNPPALTAMTFFVFGTCDFRNVFENIIFAIPDKESENYKTFKEIIF